ncbi:c-type cytochrome [Erythrobacter sp. EC-HK427]|uniref:c-type cytochrome n=1 Tax=Erythrobacter sp. EC-HK427 TaxID=2038396 RepID=UPI0012527301|nr:cytochrome c family protein [Erythrobacter sp. EC-HK427]VVT11048.1 Cytochrome C [Erythrobacter sp. EC-HK427]
MKIRLQYLSLVAGVSLLAACGGSDAPAPANEGDAPAADGAAGAADASAAAAPEAPAADDVATVDGSVFADFTGDAANGETIFAQCSACHVVEPGVNRTGPSLAGIVGRAAGSVEGYNYTPANANSGITWTAEKMFQYLENPARVVPGTKMAFAGLPNPQDRADVIAYLASTGQ